MTESDTTITTVRHDDPAFKQVKAVRTAVFIREQNCRPEEEWDAEDAVATHLLAECGGEAAGTLRYYDDDGWLHSGRVAVLQAYRGRGLARAMLRRCLDDGRNLGQTKSFLNAQVDKVGLYEREGFKPVGEEFMEAGIRHLRMEMAF